MARTIPTIEDELWELLDSHPGFPKLSRTDQRRGFEMLKAQILNGDVNAPLGFDAAGDLMDEIFIELGLSPRKTRSSKQPKPKKINQKDLERFLNSLSIFATEDERERLIENAITNPNIPLNPQYFAFRMGWDLALQTAQRNAEDILGIRPPL